MITINKEPLVTVECDGYVRFIAGRGKGFVCFAIAPSGQKAEPGTFQPCKITDHTHVVRMYFRNPESIDAMIRCAEKLKEMLKDNPTEPPTPESEIGDAA